VRGARRTLGGVRLVIATCSVDYVGRLTAHLPEATRLLLQKADGSLSVHADDRAYKPLMWMSPPCTTVVRDGVWTLTNKGGEQLVVSVTQVHHDSAHELGTDPGLVKDGVEKHLQELLADRCEVLGAGWTLVQREYSTDIGPVDLLCRDDSGAHVLVEVKRHAEIDGVEQLSRYLQRVATVLGDVRGVLAAQSFRPQAKVLAADRGITCVQLDYDALRGLESSRPTLF
jgi:endonuclease